MTDMVPGPVNPLEELHEAVRASQAQEKDRQAGLAAMRETRERWIGQHYIHRAYMGSVGSLLGKTMVLLTCKRCRALVLDNDDYPEAHAFWHEQVC